jgi:EAL domain-containing protein (putative c-di-GMP-specific phosphodiesterase class I)/GGDEF domain-containing protein
MTGLANEHLLLGALSRLLRSAPAKTTAGPVLLTVQIDQIGRIGCCFGPAAERVALETISRRLEGLAPADSLLARTAAREFTFLLPRAEPETAGLLALDLERQLLHPILIEDRPVLPIPRTGIAIVSPGDRDTRRLLRSARLAAHGAGASSTVGSRIYTDSLREETIARMQLQGELSLALDSRQLRLEYQPIISIETGKVTGFEALLRWDHPVHGTVLPDEVLPLAEETGLIGPIGDWVLSEASRQMAVWQERFPGAEELTLNVNLSGHQLGQPDLVHRVLETLQSAGLRPGTLRLELTEEMMGLNTSSIERLEQLQRHGIEIQLDDFGSGYSSLGNLSRLPVDSLKLDRTFLERCETDSRSATILQAIVALARELDLAVTAEGIETREQAERIRSLACDTGQGYFFHRPLDEEAAERLLVA